MEMANNSMSAQHTPMQQEEDLSFLDCSADGLDFNDAEDRAIFRQRVAEKLMLTRVDAIRGWMGPKRAAAMRDRFTACRVVADEYMRRANRKPA
jgi:hypothetical protein